MWRFLCVGLCLAAFTVFLGCSGSGGSGGSGGAGSSSPLPTPVAQSTQTLESIDAVSSCGGTGYGGLPVTLGILSIPPGTPIPASSTTPTVTPTPFTTIQAAIDSAANGGVVEVPPGTYNETINFNGKAVSVVSMGGPSVTTIVGTGSGPAVTFSSHESRNSVLFGFTVTNGFSSFNGGGIAISNSSPTIAGNIISRNGACSGAGISVSFGSPLIESNTISGNSQSGCTGGTGGGGIEIGGAAASGTEVVSNVISDNSMTAADGGGISLDAAGALLIENNLISGNLATGVFGAPNPSGGPAAAGGGIAMINDSDPRVIQNLIVNNTADLGGGIAFLTPSGSLGPTIVSNTIATNTSTQNYGSAAFSIGYVSSVELANNLLIGPANSNSVYCSSAFSSTPPTFLNNDAFSSGGSAFLGTCASVAGTSGNISTDPMFVNPSAGDYALSAGSPAIDAGSNSAPDLPARDFCGNPRIVDGGSGTATVDIGGYEFQTTPGDGGQAASAGGGNVSALPGATVPAGTFTASNDTGQTLTINSVALTFSNPDLFSVAEIDANAGVAISSASSKPQSGTTTFTMKPPLVLVPGTGATFKLTVTVSSTAP